MTSSTTALTEARIILPEYTPDGDFMADVHAQLEDTLVENFDGFVSYPCEAFLTGAEGFQHDSAMCYDILVTNVASDLQRLKKIALDFGNRLGQDLVYFRNPNGEVTYLGE